MKILIVEDEFYTRKALIKIINEKYSHVEKVLEAENGLIGLELLEQEKIDIIITDIKMPKINGLELIEKIKELYPEIVVIIVSGYSKFNFAQKAIKLSVKDYILKPIVKEDIYQILDAVFDELEQSRLHQNYDIENNRDAKQAIERQKINSAIQHNGTAKKQVVMELLQLASERIFYKIILIRFKSIVTEEVFNQITDTIRCKENLSSYYNYSGRNEILLVSFGEDTMHQYENEIYPKLNACLKRLVYKDKYLDYVVGISQTHSLIEEFSEAYDEAKQSLYNYLFFGWGKIYVYNENIDVNLEPHGASGDFFFRYESGLKNGNTVLCKSALKMIFNYLLNNKNTGASAIQWISMRLEIIINEVVKVNHIKLEGQMGYDNFNCIDEIEQYYEEVTLTICQSMSQKNKDASVIDALLDYMESNYYDQLNLSILAKEMYYMNPSYLSRLFSEQVGDTFSNRLLKIRMEKAKALLEEKQCSITEVATLVGYSNASYFIKTFKNYYQQTPGQYHKTETDIVL